MSLSAPFRGQVFVDTGAFFALAWNRDGHHAQAMAIVARLDGSHRPMVTTDLVVAETHALLVNRVNRDAGHRWIEQFAVPIFFTTNAQYQAARAVLRRYSDKDFTLADAVSFVVMEHLGIREVLTFDDHFRQYGLEVLAP